MNFATISNIPGINAGASEEQLDSLETTLGVRLPAAYRELLRHSNGVLLANGVSLYSTHDLWERNASYDVLTSCPGYLLIGDDSGGRGFLVDTCDDAARIYASGLGVLDPAEFATFASGLQDWVDMGLTKEERWLSQE